MSNARELAEFAAGYGAGSFAVGKNKIINGAMTIDQRNAGASVSSGFSVDRWQIGSSQSSKFTAQQNAGSVTPPAGFTNYLGLTSSSAYSVNSTDYFYFLQTIEGFNAADLGWGTANAKTVTLSFWAYSSLTGNFGASIKNYSANRSYPFTYTISAANTWTYITITVPGDTTGTWYTNNNGWGWVWFTLGSGSTRLGTANTWAGANYDGATGAVSVVGTSGATLYITGVQLEEGSVATPFENRLYGQELQLCQRYYEVSGKVTTSGYADGAGQSYVCMTFWGFNSNKRATPTITRTVDAGVSGLYRVNEPIGFYPGLTGTTLGATSTSSGRTFWDQAEFSAECEL